MKIRADFVTNSSSSSFIVITGSSEKVYPELPKVFVVDSGVGETEFGWGEYKVPDVGSRIIFSYIQYLYAKESSYVRADEMLERLENVIKTKCGVDDIVWNITTSYNDEVKNWAYIDHQSAFPLNCEMFSSDEDMGRFLFGVGSYIYLDNDNH